MYIAEFLVEIMSVICLKGIKIQSRCFDRVFGESNLFNDLIQFFHVHELSKYTIQDNGGRDD